MRQWLASAGEAVDRVRLGDDPEAVHDLRVAVRRLRAGIGMLPKDGARRWRDLRPDLRSLAKRLGEVRDLEVLLALARGFEGSAQVVSSLAGALGESRAGLMDHLDTEEPGRLMRRLDILLRRSNPAPRKRSVDDALADAREASVAALGSRRGDDLHQARIAIKRLRYALEAAVPRDARLAGLRTLQDALGAAQDLEVLAEWVAGMEPEPAVAAALVEARLRAQDALACWLASP